MRSSAQKRYREFVKEGLEKRPWEELKGQIYLGAKPSLPGTSRRSAIRKMRRLLKMRLALSLVFDFAADQRHLHF